MAKTKVGIIGGGKGGCEILDILKDINSVSIEYLSDIKSSAPGIMAARSLEIPTSTDPQAAAERIKTDIIIEATGLPEMSEKLRNIISEDTTIISGEAALFMFRIMHESKQNINSRVKSEIEIIRDGISDDVERVNEFLQQINEVTMGMKILAMNASVEAARSGAAGAGFAVVAGEIKNISDKTKTMAGKIKDLTASISDLSSKINIAIDDLK